VEQEKDVDVQMNGNQMNESNKVQLKLKPHLHKQFLKQIGFKLKHVISDSEKVYSKTLFIYQK
jgi:hypothetical protein